MESYNQICAVRDELRRASAVAFSKHLSNTGFPAPFAEFLKTLCTPEECEGLLFWTNNWPEPEKNTVAEFLKYHRMAYEIELLGFVRSEVSNG